MGLEFGEDWDVARTELLVYFIEAIANEGSNLLLGEMLLLVQRQLGKMWSGFGRNWSWFCGTVGMVFGAICKWIQSGSRRDLSSEV